MTQGGNCWTLFTPGIWKVLHAVLQRGRAIVKGGAGTATRTLGLLSGIFTYARKMDYRKDNPVHGVARDKAKMRRIALSPDQYAALGSALNQSQDVWQARVGIVLIVLTGCRRSEIEKLKISEVHAGGSCLALADSKTGFSVRACGKPVLDLLQRISPRASGEFVLPSIRSKGGFYGGLPNAWTRLKSSEPKLAGVTLRDLRRSFSSVADECNLSIPTIGSLIGHSGSSITDQYIIKADPALVVAADLVTAEIMRRLGLKPDFPNFSSGPAAAKS